MRIDDWHDIVFGIVLCMAGVTICLNAISIPFTLFPIIGFSVLVIGFAIGFGDRNMFYHCRIKPCPLGQNKYTKCMSQTDDFKNGCPKVVVKVIDV